MKNTFGDNIHFTLFGESHGQEIGMVIDGMAPGVKVDEDFIKSQLDKRRPQGRISTARQEADPFRIVSGVFNGETTGTPIAIVIPNGDTKSKDYSKTKDLARPGHADFTAQIKYHGFQDYRGGGHFSGRITTPIVAAGAIAIQALKEKGIVIGTHVKRCAGIDDDNFSDYAKELAELNNKTFAVINDAKEAEMVKAIEEAASDGDSVGGILETVVTGMPAGVGEPWFDTMESMLSHILFSVPAIKGVEFGEGFAMADMRGSQCNDAFYMDGDVVKTKTNNNGGINGGITNGMPIVIKCVVKPTPSIYKEQDTINMNSSEDSKLRIEGRHDPAIIHRARVVVDSVVALCLCDMLAGRYGTDYLAN